jgi:hypothetical protein
MFVDLDIGALLGGAAPELADKERRVLVTQNPRYKKEYKKRLQEFLVDNNLLERQRAVEKDIGMAKRITPNLQAELEDIDQLLLYGRLEAERLCGKLNMQPWTPKIRKQRLVHRYWELWRCQLNTHVDYLAQRTKLKAKLDPSDPLEPTLPEVLKLIRAANKGVKDLVVKAKEEREKFLLERAADHRLAGKVDEAKIVDMIRKMEYNTRCFAHLWRIRGKQMNGGLNFAYKRDPTDTEEDPNKCKWIRISDPLELNEELEIRNKGHFSQAEGTPFTTEPLKSLFGRHANTSASRELHNGHIPECDAPEAVTEILHHLADTRFPAVDVHIDPEDIRTGYARWREKTATSPSGLHLGHYKTLAQIKPGSEKNEEGEVIYSLSEQMFEIEASRANIALKHGYVFQRWETIVNLMLEKIKVNPCMDKLRVIHIFEADINLLLGIIWNRRLIRHGEKHGAYGEEQWGSQPGRSCEEVLLLKQLTYSLMELTRTPGRTFDNNAKACFD